VGLRWEYFPAHSAVLLDKVYKLQHNMSGYELGGEAAMRVLADKGVSAVHTTCYEQKTKVMGLKVTDRPTDPPHILYAYHISRRG